MVLYIKIKGGLILWQIIKILIGVGQGLDQNAGNIRRRITDRMLIKSLG
jgi:hypothetical protein